MCPVKRDPVISYKAVGIVPKLYSSDALWSVLLWRYPVYAARARTADE